VTRLCEYCAEQIAWRSVPPPPDHPNMTDCGQWYHVRTRDAWCPDKDEAGAFNLCQPMRIVGSKTRGNFMAYHV